MVFLLVLFSIVSYLFVLNYHTSLVDEDFSLVNRPIGFSLDSWNVRLPGDFGASIILKFSPVAYAIFQTLIIILLLIGAIIVSKIISKKRFGIKNINYIDSVALLSIFLLTMFVIPVTGQILFWRTGTSNYLYPFVMALWYIIPIVKLAVSSNDIFNNIKNRAVKISVSTIYSLVGAVIGMGFENLSPLVFIIAVGTIIYLRIRKKNIPIWLVFSIFFILVGIFLLLFSSGTQMRVEYYQQVYNDYGGYVTHVLNHIVNVARTYKSLIAIPFTLWLFLLFAIEKALYKRMLIIMAASLVLSLLSILILSSGIYIVPRAFFFAIYIIFIPVVMEILNIDIIRSKVAVACIVFILLLSVPTFVKEMDNRIAFYRARQSWIQYVDHEYNIKQGSKLTIVSDSMPQFSSQFTYPGVNGGIGASRLNEYFKNNKLKIVVQ